MDVLQTLVAMVDYSVRFLILNPDKGQAAPNVTISATADGLPVVDGVELDRGDGTYVGSEPLLINEFVFANIGQSDPGQGVVNTIFVTVATRAEVFKTNNPFFIFCNLAGTTTPSGTLALTDRGGSGATGVFGSAVDWTQGTVSINFQSYGDNCIELNFDGAAANSVASKQYSFSFELTNPLTSQEGPSPIIIAVFFRFR